MRPANIKKLRYKDEVMRRHRRSFVFKIVVIVFLTIIVVAGLTYLLFFSRMFDVREISFNGLDTVSSDVFRAKIDDNLNQKILGYLPRRNNIFFIDTGNFENEFASSYPVFKSVDIKRKLLHGLVFDFLERKPLGIWCFRESCSYFDNDQVLWGQPSKSSGFIFLAVDDQRVKTEQQTQQIDDEFFKPITEVAKILAGEIRNIIIPEGSFNEFRVYTADYYIIFTIDFNIQNQLDTLKIFMTDKAKTPPSADGFHPQYIDLRIDGRVYYK